MKFWTDIHGSQRIYLYDFGGFECNFLSTIRWIAIEFGTFVRVPFRAGTKLSDFSQLLDTP